MGVSRSQPSTARTAKLTATIPARKGHAARRARSSPEGTAEARRMARAATAIGVLSAGVVRFLKGKRGAAAPLFKTLRAAAREDVGAWTRLLPGLCTDARLDAVRRGRRRLDDDVLDALVVGGLQ